METKDQLVSVREWVKLDNEMKSSKNSKKRRDKKTNFSFLVETMKQNEIEVLI